MLSTAASVGEWALIVAVLLGAVPPVTAILQFLNIGLHRWRSHHDRTAPYLPRVAILLPAWNEAAVLTASIDRLMTLDYPAESVRVYVVDDASTDATPEVVRAKARQYPGRVVHLRRAAGGQGKAHTLNHGLAEVLADDWMQALLIMDADVVYDPAALRRMTRHLADPVVGAVTAYIKEGSEPGSLLTRLIGYEYATAQAAARRSQNVGGVLACLAGGAQLHSRANLEAIGGRIDTGSLAEDTVTTFRTQLLGRRAIFEGNAIAWAEEPDSVLALWKQRLRWARGNVQITRRFRTLWFRPTRSHGFGGIGFGIGWFAVLLQPILMIASSVGLVTLYFTDSERARSVFMLLWVVTLAGYLFTTLFTLSIDPETARRTWRSALLFPGVVSTLVMLYTAAPRLFDRLGRAALDLAGLQWTLDRHSPLVLLAYGWLSACMLVAYAAKAVEGGRFRRLGPLLLAVGGYGPLLCAVTFASYLHELRGAAMTWEKTEKTGKLAAR